MTAPSSDRHAAIMSLAGRMRICADIPPERIARWVARGVHIKRSPLVGKEITKWPGRDLGSQYHPGGAVSRILVVDDEQRICRFVARALEANGFQFQVAANGYEALRLVESQDYAVIVLDLLLPGLDGYEVLRRVLQANPAQ